MATMSQVCETAVVISAAHADTIAVSVESDSRCNDHVEVSRVDEETAHGFPDTELISFELGIRRHFAKCHFCAGAQNRDENALVCAPTSFDDFSSIHFIVHRQEARDCFARIPGVRCAHAITNDVGRAGALVRRHITARVEGALAK